MRPRNALLVVAMLFSVHALAQPRSFLTEDQARSFILSRPFTVVRNGDGRAIHFDFKADGTVFENTFRASGVPVSSSGTWQLNESNAKICVEFSAARTKGVCFGLVQDADAIRLYTGKRTDPVPWAVVQ